MARPTAILSALGRTGDAHLAGPLEGPVTQRGGAAGQRPVGGTFDVLSESLRIFIFFAARFSFNVLPCFFALDFCGDLSDTVIPSARYVQSGRTPCLDLNVAAARVS